MSNKSDIVTLEIRQLLPIVTLLCEMDFQVTENETVKIARRFGLWIRLAGYWYSPRDFVVKFKGNEIGPDTKHRIEFLNPSTELRRGVEVIYRWVAEGRSPKEIKKAFDKALVFADKIAREYKPVGWTLDMQNKDEVIREYHASDVWDRVIFEGWDS